jgi:UDP-3-O-[3-hydroxymyristoyl] glucosamine N-acyltransferase
MNPPVKSIALGQIAALIGSPAPPAAVAEVSISGVSTLEDAGPEDLSFLGADSFLKQFAETRAAAVLVQKNVKLVSSPRTPTLAVDDADLAIAKVLEVFYQPPQRPTAGVDALAKVDPTAVLAQNAAVGAFSFVGSGTRIASGTIIHPHVYIGSQVEIGPDCEIFPHVTIRERIKIGARVIIHAGSALGTDGFGYRWDGSRHAKIPHIGTVIIEDDVEIGSCVCIDRAKFADTRIGRGTKIDNLVQVAHNVIIGPHCILVGQAGLAGSTTLGAGVVLGGQAAVRDHVNLGDGAMVAACGAVADNVPPHTIVSGMPALPHRQTLREQAALRRLPDLVVQVRKLQEEIKACRGPTGE